MSTQDPISYIDKIPNNVDLGRDRVLQRALEHWQPAYMGWWFDMGPAESIVRTPYWSARMPRTWFSAVAGRVIARMPSAPDRRWRNVL